MKNIAKPIKNMIPIMLKIFNHLGGCESWDKYFPVTNLKLKIAIMGAMRKETVVAKSTSSFSLSLNWNTTTNDPIARIKMNKTYVVLNFDWGLKLFFVKDNWKILSKDLE